MRALLSAVVVLTCVAFAQAGEEKVALDKLPKAVSESIKKRFPKGEMSSATKETEDKKTTYEVSLKDAGSNYDVNVNEDGTITGFEKEVAVKDMPKAVVAAAVAKYPTAKQKKGEEVYTVADGKETLAYYEVIFEIDGKDVEVEVLANGTLKPVEKK
jgi:hypothetical protein